MRQIPDVPAWALGVPLLLCGTACAHHYAGDAGAPAESLSPEAAASYQAPPRLDDGWQTATPEELGLARGPLEAMTEALRRDEYPNVHAVLVAKEGKLVHEEYFTGTDRRWRPDGERHTVELTFDRDTLHETRSVGKSVTSALVGLAIASGAIPSVDRPLLDYFPEEARQASAAQRGITLEHALTMSAGLDWNEGDVPYTDPANHSEQMAESEDPPAFVLGRPLADEPGERWSYNSGLPVLLGLAVAEAVGQPFGAFAREALFEPLGITDLEWAGPPAWAGIPALAWDGSEIWSRVATPGGSMWLRPRDLLKIGALYLDGGRWNGKRILPEEWIEESLRPRIERPGFPRQHGESVVSHGAYGYFWWHDRYQLPYGELVVHAAYGNGGQRIWVVPELDLVAVHLTGNYNRGWASYQAERLLLERIVPWAMGIDASYEHEIQRTVRVVSPEEWPTIQLTAEERARYLGVYEFDEWDRMEVFEEDGTLLFTLPGSGTAHLIPDGLHRFAQGRIENGEVRKIFWPDDRFQFVFDEEGDVVRCELRDVETGVVNSVGRLMEEEQE